MTNSEILSSCIHWVDHLKRHCVRYDAPDYGRKGRSLIGQYKKRAEAEAALLAVLGPEVEEAPFQFPVRSSVLQEDEQMSLPTETLKKCVSQIDDKDGQVVYVLNALIDKIVSLEAKVALLEQK